MKAIRGMIDAGSGFPPHWRGEAADVNLATAQAMQIPTERHLKRRQDYFVFVLKDIIYHAYQRAHQLLPDVWPALPSTDYSELFTAAVPDISQEDNGQLALAAKDMAVVASTLATEFPGSTKLQRFMLQMILKFAGEPQKDDFLDQVMKETAAPTTRSDDADGQPATKPQPNGVSRP
jgi:hypothetical protein